MVTEIISEKEKEFYLSNGYLLNGKQLFSAEKFNKLKAIFEETLAENNGDVDSSALDTPHFKDKRLMEFLLADEVLDVVEGLIGPNIGLWSSHFICKQPQTGKRTPWHEDSAYWQGRFNNFDKVVTIWLALDDATIENGCMGVVPGTHINGFSEYGHINTDMATFNTEIVSEVNEDNVVWFELKQGTYSLHDSKIIHGARANTSNTRRTGYTMRYFSTDMILDQNHPKNKDHKVYHCRGLNTGNNPLIYQ